MKSKVYIFLALLATVFVACVKEHDGPRRQGSDDSAAPIVGSVDESIKGEIFVKFNPQASDVLDRGSLKTRSGRPLGKMTRSGMSDFDRVLDSVGGYALERVFPVDERHEERVRKFRDMHLWYRISFDSLVPVSEVARRFAALGEVAKVEYNRELKRMHRGEITPVVSANAKRALTRALDTPGDPMRADQWHYINQGAATATQLGLPDRSKGTMAAGSDVNLAAAWEKCTGDPSVVVAVLDEGLMFSHEDLAANMWVNPGGEIWKSDEDNDGNGYKGDVYGYNFATDSGVITFDHNNDTGHGTHIAGTIAGVNNNGVGISGIAGGDGTPDSGVKLMSIQIWAGGQATTILNEVRGVKYAADNGAVILNCSWGYMSAYMTPSNGLWDDETFEGRYSIEKEAFDYFIYNAGSPEGVIDGGLVIFAAGNEYSGMSSYPAAHKNYISVAAIDGQYLPSVYTNYGPGTDISAPGGDGEAHLSAKGGVLSTTLPQSGALYGYSEGTSMACPHVVGVAALGLSYAAKLRKHFTHQEYKALLLNSVRPLDSHFSGDKLYWENYVQVDSMHPTKLALAKFRGKMGGLSDAGILLDNIENPANGKTIRIPNVFVGIGNENAQTIDVTLCFPAGATVTAASSADTDIATVSFIGNKVTITGTGAGGTTLSVTAGGETKTAHITVRRNVGPGGGVFR